MRLGVIGIVAAMAVCWQGVVLMRPSVTTAEAQRHQPATAARPDDAAGCLVCAGRLGAVLLISQCRPQPMPAVGFAESETQRVLPLQVVHPPARGPPIGA
jgi:hypothetical protein